MVKNRHPHSALIDELGKGVVQQTFSLSAQALWQWRERGVPVTKRIAFAKVAADHAVTVPADFFDEIRGIAA